MAGGSPSDAGRRRVWMLRLWWVWVPVGVALIIYGLVSGSDLGQRGGPFLIGLFLLIWGARGAWIALMHRGGRAPDGTAGSTDRTL